MATIDKTYIKIYHNSPEIKTVGDFVDNDENSIVSSYIGKESEFLAYKGDTPLTNRSRILQSYTAKEAKDSTGKTDAQLLLKVGTELLLPKSEIQLSNTYAVSLEPYDTSDFNAFVTDTLKELLKNPNYKSVSSNGAVGKFVDFYPQISIWCWIRSIDAYLDVSPFVQQVSTSSNDQGGTFSLILAPIVASKDSENNWIIDRASISSYNSNSLSDNYSAESKLFKIGNLGELKQNNFYFHNIISPNDLFFIRYETLDMESKTRKKDLQKFNISYLDLPNKTYDMIGMVDQSSLSIQPASSEISIAISGRDLTKTIIDDGSYFYIEEYLANIFASKEMSEKLRKRIYGRLVTFQTLGKRSIQQSINLVINSYSATGYVPEDVFRAYGENRNKIISEDLEANAKAKDSFGDNLNKYKDAAIFQIEKSRVSYGISNASDASKIEDAFNKIVKLIEDDNLAENNFSNLTQTAISSLDNILFDRDKILSDLSTSIEGTALNNTQAYVQLKNSKPQDFTKPQLKDGVWQIIDIEVDSSVANIRLADSSISEANGSLINTIKSFCQEPFAEFFTDTYGDRFKFIARRPPYNQKSYNDLAETCSEIIIEPEDVIAQNLSFSDSEVYSYYLLRPKAFLGGTSSEMSLAFLPAVVFKEYVDMFGSRPYDKVSNFITFAPKNNENKVNIERAQIVKNLKFMIDSTVYLPFTRKGTIVINGDRRIKKKTIVYNRMTDELCYVDSVQHNFVKSGSVIDRTTTLSVSRCMVKKFAKPVNIEGVENKVSYFSIVNTPIEEKFFIGEGKSNIEILENWDLSRNKSGVADVFDFFMKKRQFE